MSSRIKHCFFCQAEKKQGNSSRIDTDLTDKKDKIYFLFLCYFFSNEQNEQIRHFVTLLLCYFALCTCNLFFVSFLFFFFSVISALRNATNKTPVFCRKKYY